MSTEFSFSEVVLPWRARRNPAHRAYVEQSLQRVIEMGLIAADSEDPAHIRFEAFVELAGWAYPTAALEDLVTVGSFDQWLFFLDDQYDNDPGTAHDRLGVERLMRQALASLLGGSHDRSPFSQFSRWVGERLAGAGSTEWFARFRGHVADYLFKGSLRAMRIWQTGELPALPEYIAIRQHDSAVHAVVDLIEIAQRCSLPEEAWHEPELAELRRITVEHVALFNDLVSYEKEVLRHGYPFNALHVWMQHESTDLNGAARALVARLNRDLLRFDDLAAGFAAGSARAAVAEGMRDWIAGNVAFSFVSGRYSSPSAPFVELRQSWIPRALLGARRDEAASA